MISLADLLTVQTADQVNETFLSTLDTLGVPARSWRKAGAYRTILRVVAIAYAIFSQLAVDFISGGFLENATGGWLTLLAFFVYGVSRIDAVFATGYVTLVNAKGGVFTFGTGEATFKNEDTGATYFNSAPFTLNANATLTIPVQAVTLGSAGTSAAGAIDTLVTQMYGVTVANDVAIVGLDAEKDPDLRVRCKAKLGTLSPNGPRGAFEYAAKSAKRIDGSDVGINRVQVSPFSSTGVVNLYVANATGVPVSSDVDAVKANVIAQSLKGATDTLGVFAGTPIAYTRTLTVWARSRDGVSASDLQTLVLAALIDAIDFYPIAGLKKSPDPQGYLFATYIEGIAKAAHESIFAVDGAGPDLALNDGQFATNAVTIAAVRVVEAAA